jgi:tripartite-type tricarboxylate transporter receptor subunit TctC
VSVFFGIVAPAGTPADRIAKLNHAFAEVLHSPKVKQMFASQGLETPADTSPQKLGQFIATESVKWKDVVQKSGAQLD